MEVVERSLLIVFADFSFFLFEGGWTLVQPRSIRMDTRPSAEYRFCIILSLSGGATPRGAPRYKNGYSAFGRVSFLHYTLIVWRQMHE
uniref:Uncharacterized protein n=1 Tax=viral metagenome TaxID=1070528 RepID=A0A6C0K381_9ZZZZ